MENSSQGETDVENSFDSKMGGRFNMDIAEKINEIVKKRQEKIPQIIQMQQRLTQINKVVADLENTCQEMLEKSLESSVCIAKENLTIFEQLRTIDTATFHNYYDNVQDLLEQLKIRFSRKQIHISFVGRAGQGKSLVMQNISGLSGEIIPSSNGEDCTGAKSIITNSGDDTVTAEITFYTRKEYKDIVNKYLSEIFGKDVYEIDSVDEIEGLKQKQLQSKIDITSAQKQSLYLQLEKYIEHSAEVIPLLGSVKKIPAEEIESYVAQYNSKYKKQKYFTYLGVKVANILCAFPYKDCGKIVLVDTIGLGATALDIREQMLETVSNDSDVILLMTRPDAQRPRIEQDDIDIVNDISKKMTADYTRRMLFWIINEVNSDVSNNTAGIPFIMETLKKMPDFPVADKLRVDCKDKETVEKKLLVPVLEKLSRNLPEMDDVLLGKAEKSLYRLYQEYHLIANRIGETFKASVDEDAKREFDSKIVDIIGEMTNSVRELYLESGPYGKERRNVCESLKTASEEKLKNILKLVPEKETVMEVLNVGTKNQLNVYEIFTNQIRIAIIDDFLKLNVTLHDLVKKMKQDVLYCLADETQGKLGRLFNASTENEDEWLEKMISYLSGYPRYKLIVEALKKLADFDLKMESYLIYRVRNHLDVIDLSVLGQVTIKGKKKEEQADDIIFWLEHNLEIVYKSIKEELEPLYSYPNSALWAVVKDFYDRIVCAKDGKREVTDEWRYLYEDSIPCIWEDEYLEYQQQKGVSDKWNFLVNKIRKYDDKNQFEFTYMEVE